MSVESNNPTKPHETTTDQAAPKSQLSTDSYEDFGLPLLKPLPELSTFSSSTELSDWSSQPSAGAPNNQGEWSARLEAAKAFGVVESMPFLAKAPEVFADEQAEDLSLTQETLAWLEDEEPRTPWQAADNDQTSLFVDETPLAAEPRETSPEVEAQPVVVESTETVRMPAMSLDALAQNLETSIENTTISQESDTEDFADVFEEHRSDPVLVAQSSLEARKILPPPPPTSPGVKPTPPPMSIPKQPAVQAPKKAATLDLPSTLFDTEEPEQESPQPSPLSMPQVPKVLPKGWWNTLFNEDYLRSNPARSEATTLKEADFVEACLAPKAGDTILDIGCGYGRHVIELARRGHNVVGLDLSIQYIMLAAALAQRDQLAANFVHGDMRDMQFPEYFDSAYSLFTSFGYFDDETNSHVLRSIARALKPKGKFLLELVNRDFAATACPIRGWWEGKDCVMLEETDFDYTNSVLTTKRSVIFEDGRQAMQETNIRLYSLHELTDLFRQVGFKILEISGGMETRNVFFGSYSKNLILLAEKQG